MATLYAVSSVGNFLTNFLENNLELIVCWKMAEMAETIFIKTVRNLDLILIISLNRMK